MLLSGAYPLLRHRGGSSRGDARAWQRWGHHDHGRIARSRERIEYRPDSHHRSRQPRELALRGGDLSSRGGVGAAGAPRPAAPPAPAPPPGGPAGPPPPPCRGGEEGHFHPPPRFLSPP